MLQSIFPARIPLMPVACWFAKGVIPVIFTMSQGDLMAASSSLDIEAGATVAWETALWSNGVPGAGDDAILTRGSGNNSILALSAGTLSLRSLSYSGGTNQLRIVNHSSDDASRLVVSERVEVEKGRLIFGKTGSGEKFGVETPLLQVRDGGIAQVGLNNAGIFFSSARTEIDAGGIVQVGWQPSGGISFGEVINNGTFYLAGGSTTVNGAYEVKVASLAGSSASVVSTMDSTAVVTPTLIIDANTSETAIYHGTISDGIGVVGVKKQGNGTQIFASANSYSGGTAIEGGILAITNTSGSGLGSGGVVVQAGGVLAGDGTQESTESIVVEEGGVIAPGALEEGFATLHLDGSSTGDATLVMEEGAAFVFNLGISNQSDAVEFLSYEIGDFELHASGIALRLENVQAGEFTLFSFTDGLGDATASGITEGLFVEDLDAAYSYTISYNNAFGEANYGSITLNIQAIPEAGSLVMLGLGALLLGVAGRGVRKLSQTA